MAKLPICFDSVIRVLNAWLVAVEFGYKSFGGSDNDDYSRKNHIILFTRRDSLD